MKIRKPFYTTNDIEFLDHLNSKPGEAPFIRGPFAEMYRKKPWTIRQYTGFASATETNLAFKKSLAEGGQGLSVAFDLATQLGFDSDHPLAKADVGRTGVAIDSVYDMKQLFTGIDLNEVSVSMTMNGAVLPTMAAYIVAAEENGIDPAHLRGTIQNDILKEFMVRNTYIFNPEFSMRICTDVVEYLNRELPLFNSMSISGYHFQEAGAEPALELALTLANASAYLDCITMRGLDLERFCPRLSFFFGIGMNFFEEIAKLRAARVLWSREIEQRGTKSDEARRMKIHCQTSGWSLAAHEPYNNLIRTTIEAMAAVFGGTQSLHTNAYDETLSLPTVHSARLARNTQLIMQHEMGLCEVADPWGGSYMMEALTNQVAKSALIYLDQIKAKGGILAALKSGWVNKTIDENALRMQGKIDNCTQTIVGVNRFAEDSSNHFEFFDTNGGNILEKQCSRLTHLKKNRDSIRVNHELAKLSQAALNPNANLLEYTIEAIRSRATVGECTQALLKNSPRHQNRNQFQSGVYQGQRQGDIAWHRAQRQVRNLVKKRLQKPSVLMVKLGLDGHDRGIKVVSAGLNDVGFDIDMGPLFSTPDQVCTMLHSKHYDALGISILSGSHSVLICELLAHIQQHSDLTMPIVFVGGIIPDNDIPLLQSYGVTEVFRPGTTIEEITDKICRTLIANNMKKAK